MTAYFTDEAVFELPDVPLVDRTVNSLVAPLPGGGSYRVLVCRSPLPRDRSLRDAVAALVEHEALSLAGHAVLGEREIAVADSLGLEVESRWREGSQPLYQLQAHLVAGAAWLMVSGTTAMKDRAACAAWTRNILGSLRLRGAA